jgi:hypothetical protein
VDESISIRDIAAWWGAVVATLALGWNVFTALRSGARVRVRAYPNMKLFPAAPPTGDDLFITVTAVNRGNAATTITHFMGHYQPRAPFYKRRPAKQLFVVNVRNGVGQDVPHVLKPGEQWHGLARQEGQFDLTKGDLFIGIQHNQREKPILRKVRL